MDKQIRKVITQLEAQGWRIEQGRHLKAFPPDKTKSMVVISLTPSDHRALKNLIAQLRRNGANL